MRVTSTGRSANAAAATEDVLINLDSLNRILDVDSERLLVRAQVPNTELIHRYVYERLENGALYPYFS